MFSLNIGHSTRVATTVAELQGSVTLPSGNSIITLQRGKAVAFQRRLFDPQLYLATLDPSACRKTCSLLGQYPWFGVDGELPAFDSSVLKKSDWYAIVSSRIADIWTRSLPDDISSACIAAIEFQLGASCTHILLPTPLIEAREDEAAATMEWLDAGIDAAEQLQVAQPIIATLAVAASVLNADAFSPSGILDSAINQIRSREAIDGAYIVVTRAQAEHPFVADVSVWRAYMHLCRAFSRLGYDFVMTNFADVLGLVCMGLGATDFGSGETQKLRRLSLAGFRDDGWGRALPHFYSHRIVQEFLPESDLLMVRDQRLLRRVIDETQFSKPLFDTLRRGATGVGADWAESQNNVSAAQKHFVCRLATAAGQITGMDADDRRDAVRGWLEDAAANQTYLSARLDAKQLTPSGLPAPVNVWLDLFDAFTSAF